MERSEIAVRWSALLNTESLIMLTPLVNQQSKFYVPLKTHRINQSRVLCNQELSVSYGIQHLVSESLVKRRSIIGKVL